MEGKIIKIFKIILFIAFIITLYYNITNFKDVFLGQISILAMIIINKWR